MNLKKIFLAFALIGTFTQAQNEESFNKLMKLPIKTINMNNGDIFLQGNFDDVLGVNSNLKKRNFKQDHQHRAGEMSMYEMARFLNQPHPSINTIRKYLRDASIEFNVPFALLDGIAKTNNNYNMIGPSPNGGYGIMTLTENSYCNTLEQSANLLGLSKEDLKFNAKNNIRGAAALLSNMAGQNSSSKKLENWFDAVKSFTGLYNDQLKEMKTIEIYKTINEGSSSITLWKENADIMPLNDPALSNLINNSANKTTDKASNLVTQAVDFPGAIPNFITCNKGSRNGTPVEVYVNHWIGFNTVADAISLFSDCNSAGQTSAHFIVGRDGKVYQLVDVLERANHAFGANQFSIGVEHEATVANPQFWNSQPLLQSSTDLARTLTTRFSIPKVRITNVNLKGIIGHSDINATQCPGNLPWTTWLNMLNNPTVNNIPTTTNPLNNATGVVRPVNLSWTSPVNATAFRLQVSKSNTGWTETDGFTSATSPSSTVVVNASLSNVLNFFWQDDNTAGTFEGPKPNTSYFYTVRSFDATTGTSKYSAVKKFTTDEGVNLTSPAFGATVNVPVALTWTSTIGTNGSYRIQIAKSSTGWTAANGFTSGTTTTTNVVVNNSFSGSTSYTWQNGSAGSSSAPVAGTTYYWTVRLFNPANSFTSSYSPVRSFKISSAAVRIFKESTYSEDILIYPNPANNIINVAIKDNKENCKVEIISYEGNIMKSTEMKSEEVSFDTTDLREGIYILRITNKSGSKTSNIFISKK